MLTSFVQDPATSTGAEVANLRYPASYADMVTIYANAGKDFPGPVRREGERRHEFRQSAEAKASRVHMSPLFQGL